MDVEITLYESGQTSSENKLILNKCDDGEDSMVELHLIDDEVEARLVINIEELKHALRKITVK